MPNHDVIITGYYYPGSEEEPQPPAPTKRSVSYYEQDNTTFITYRNYEVGSTIVPIEHPDIIGYRNDGWQGFPPNMIMPDEDIRVHKSYTKIPTVVFYVDNSIYQVQTYEIGDTITLPTDPTLSGYRFMRWNGLPKDNLITDTSTIEVNSVFEKTYTITYIIQEN